MTLSGEAVLISALLSNGDVGAAKRHGITPTHFVGYSEEYNWLLNYIEQYGHDPSKDIFRVAFPHFTFSEHTELRSACDMVFKSYGRIQITTAMSEAMDHMNLGDVTLAANTLNGVKILRTHPKPKRVLTDMGFLDNWDEPMLSIDTPYRTVNRHTGGMRPGNLWYLAGRPGQGKSAHLVNFVVNAVLQGCRVKFYSLEMNENEVRARFHAALATHYGYKGIDLNGIRDRSIDSHVYKEFVGELSDLLQGSGGSLDMHSPKEGLVTPGLVANGAEEYHLNVIDYIGLMRGDGGGRTQEWQNLAAISNDLKCTAGSSESVFLVASQINREGEVGKEPPKISNLAGSDALAQDGDVVITMRSWQHNVATRMSLEKNRHGLGGIRFQTVFDPNHGVFPEITVEQADELALAAEDEVA